LFFFFFIDHATPCIYLLSLTCRLLYCVVGGGRALGGGGGAGNKDKARAVSFLRLGHTRDHMPTQIANNALSPPTRNTRKQRSEPTNNELERWNMVHLPPFVMSLSG